jgi:hypothetical protein
VFVWSGYDFQEITSGKDVLDSQTFVQKCIENYWGSAEAKNLKI